MKTYQKILWFIAVPALLCAGYGCNHDDARPHDEPSEQAITIRIRGMGESQPATYADPVHEPVTTPLHVWIYKPGENVPVLYFAGNLVNDTDTVVTHHLSTGFNFALTYDVYVLGTAGSVAAGISRTDLERMVQRGIGAINGGTKSYIFAGRAMNKLLSSVLNVNVTRNVCRVELDMTDLTGAFTSVSAELTAPDRTYAFSPGVWGSGTELPAGLQDTTYSIALSKTGSLYSGRSLFFEDYRTGAKTRLTIRVMDRGAERIFFTCLNKDGGYTTDRNTIYRVSVAAGSWVDIRTTMVPWSIDAVSGSLYPATAVFNGGIMPFTIPKNGVTTVGFTFSNPAGTPFQLFAIVGENPDGAVITQSANDGAGQKNLSGFAANPGTGNRTISFWYKQYGDWFDTGVRATQQGL